MQIRGASAPCARRTGDATRARSLPLETSLRQRLTASPTWILVTAASAFSAALLLALTLRAPGDAWVVVGVPAGVAVVIGAIQRPQWVLVGLCALLVAESLASVKGISLYKALTPVMLGGIIAQYAMRRLEPIGLDLMDALVVFWIVYNAILVPTALAPEWASADVKKGFNVALFYAMSSRLMVEERWRERLVLGMVGFSVVLVFYGLVTFYGGAGVDTDWGGVRRFTISGSGDYWDKSRLVEPNLFAAYLFLPLFLLVARIGSIPTASRRLIALGGVGVLVAGMMLTYSRSAFVVLVACMGLFAIRTRIRPRHVAILGLAGLAALPFVPESYWERISTLIEGESASEGSLEVRGSLVFVGLRLFREHPFFGAGPGSFLTASAMSDYQDEVHLLGKGYVAHNLYLEVLAETGLVGFALFGSLILLALIRLRTLARLRPKDPLVMGLELALVSFLLSSLFLSTGTNKSLWLMLGLVRVLSDPMVMDRMASTRSTHAPERDPP